MADSDASNVHFIAISPKGSFTTGNGAVELRHQKPDGDVTAKDGINDKVGMAATINVTKPMSHGKVTFVAETPKVAGIVSAMLLIGSDSQDEIDTEILGGDVDHWQTNFFVTPPGSEPIFGTLMAMMTPTPPVPIHSSCEASSTSWVKGPIDWKNAPDNIRTLIHSVKVEC
ncbi:concanavalin A-like lectin/glucanase [Desarmillaria ectypa]|nr:concanavalin A-like lectin/glucanase [Desarmillaria ectypa]